MSDEGFVILLGEEEPNKDAATEQSENASTDKDDDSFVILLNQEEPDVDAADLTLSTQCTIENVRALHSELQSIELDSGKDVRINASAVSQVDTASLQLLLSFFRAAQSRGVSPRLERPSDCFSNNVRRLGLSEDLGFSAHS